MIANRNVNIWDTTDDRSLGNKEIPAGRAGRNALPMDGVSSLLSELPQVWPFKKIIMFQ